MYIATRHISAFLQRRYTQGISCCSLFCCLTVFDKSLASCACHCRKFCIKHRRACFITYRASLLPYRSEVVNVCYYMYIARTAGDCLCYEALTANSHSTTKWGMSKTIHHLHIDEVTVAIDRPVAVGMRVIITRYEYH